MKSETMATHSSIVQASNISRHCNFLGCYPQGSLVKFVGGGGNLPPFPLFWGGTWQKKNKKNSLFI